MKKTIRDIDVAGKRVFVRVDYNVPINNELKITDDTRIIATIPTISYLIDHGARVIICSHLGRPRGQVDNKLSLRPVLARLSKILEKPVSFAEDITSNSTLDMVNHMKNGDVLMLENIRFYKQEEENDDQFAKKLARLADVFVLEAFGTAHRKHASTYGIAKHVPGVVGFLVEHELNMFNKILVKPEHPFVAILGGAKVTDKLPVIENLLDKVDDVLIGGGMAFTFVKALGGNVGMSLVDNTQLETAKAILDKAKEMGVKITLPIDVVAADEFSEEANCAVFNSGLIADGYQSMDIGKKTIKQFKKVIRKARTIVWNGPLGVYEYERFRHGTNKVAKYVAKSKAVSVVGGGDTIAAVQTAGVGRNEHLSTGGGASLMLLQGKSLPCVELIEEI